MGDSDICCILNELVPNRMYRCNGGRFVKQFAWVIVVIQSLLIIASRKHYTVDVVVAW